MVLQNSYFGDNCCNCNFSDTGVTYFKILKIINDSRFNQRDISVEKRVSLTPETAKNIIGLGLKVCVEKNYANHLGISDDDYRSAGVEIKNNSNEVLKSSNLIIKVNCPSENEISSLEANTILIGLLNPQKIKIYSIK